MTVIQSRVEVLGGIPLPSTRAEAARILLGPMLKFGVRVHQGPTLSRDTGLEPLNDFMRDRPNFNARGRSKFEASFAWGTKQPPGIPALGSLTTFIQGGAAPPDVLLDSLARTVALLEAPIAYMDDWAQSGFKERRENHRTVFQESKKAGEDKRFGLFRGLSGIAWRTILGPDLVRFFGQKTLSSLAPHLAQRLGDEVWLLTPCDAANEWSSDAFCEGEAEIVDVLGKANFYDPMAKKLPTRMPDIRMMPTFPVKFLSPDARNALGPFEHHNGYVES